MIRFINRNYKYNEHDDFIRNVDSLITVWKNLEAIPIYNDKDGLILGWIIQHKKE